MKSQILLSLTLTPLVMFVLTLLTAPPSVSVRVTPRFGLEPLSIRVVVRIEPSIDNKIACLSYDGPQFSESCWQLNDGSSRTVEKTFTDLPAGSYTVTASVKRANGSVKIATTNVCSISTGLSPETCQTGDF